MSGKFLGLDDRQKHAHLTCDLAVGCDFYEVLEQPDLGPDFSGIELCAFGGRYRQGRHFGPVFDQFFYGFQRFLKTLEDCTADVVTMRIDLFTKSRGGHIGFVLLRFQLRAEFFSLAGHEQCGEAAFDLHLMDCIARLAHHNRHNAGSVAILLDGVFLQYRVPAHEGNCRHR